MKDLIIKDINIVDGLNNPIYTSNIGISNGKIEILESTENESCHNLIDGNGLYLSPGFIDAHSHGDIALGKDFSALSKVSQGVTTEIVGQCGFSMAPINPKTLNLLQEDLCIFTDTFPKEMNSFTCFKNYFAYAENIPLVLNAKFLVGHCTLRTAIMGFDNRTPTSSELEKMKKLLREAMENGCMGLSTGLIYTPGVYANSDEIIELCKVVREYNGFYCTHMRNESFDLLNSVKEAINVAKEAQVSLVISHHKAQGKRNWGLPKQTLKLVNDAINEGLDITLDQYPYTASMTHLYVSIPPKYISNGIGALINNIENPTTREEIKKDILDPYSQFDNQYQNCDGFKGIFIADCPYFTDPIGMTIDEYAKKVDKDPFDVFFDIIVKNKGICTAIYFSMCNEDLCDIAKFKNTIIGSDGIVKSMEAKVHPRAYNTFPKAINFFHKEKKIFTLEEIIRKMTGLTAERLKLKNKGIIKNGYDADLLIFDYDKIKDRGTFAQGNLLADGIEYVIVNGEIVYKCKELTGKTPGKIIKA